RNRTAQKCHFALPGQHHVGDEAAAPMQMASVLLAPNPGADALPTSHAVIAHDGCSQRRPQEMCGPLIESLPRNQPGGDKAPQQNVIACCSWVAILIGGYRAVKLRHSAAIQQLGMSTETIVRDLRNAKD